MQEMRVIRRARLKRLLDEQFPGRGGQALLAQVLERQTGYISRCLSGEKPIGEVFARHIEERLHLPRYWLDGDHAESGHLTQQQFQLIERFVALTPRQQQEVLELLDQMHRRNAEVLEHFRLRVAVAPEDVA